MEIIGDSFLEWRWPCSFRSKLPVTTTVSPSNSYCLVGNYDPSTPTTRPCRRVQRQTRDGKEIS
jgi:hypothetical protein